jgi:hypothetical protein
VSTATLDRGQRRRPVHLVLPDAPDDAEKTSYAWRSLPLLTAALMLSSACVIAAQFFFETRNPIALPFALYTCCISSTRRSAFR